MRARMSSRVRAACRRMGCGAAGGWRMGGNKEYGDATEPLPVSPWPEHRGVAKGYA